MTSEAVSMSRSSERGSPGSPAADGLSLGARLWGWLQDRANPIVVKELRATVRQRRFLITHLVAVTLVAVLVVGVVVATGGGEMAALEASQVGQELFYVCAGVQALLILLLVPGMTAPALVEERANLSLDLLITTRLSPRQIVVGKLLASLVAVLLLLVSWMPLVAVTFLFGGVGLKEVLWLYLGLTALAVLLAALSLHCSAVERSPRRAVIYAYFLAFGLGVVLPVLGGPGLLMDLMPGPGSPRGPGGAVGGVQAPFLLVVVPTYFFVLVTGAFLLSAINRMKPPSANRSTGVRMFLTAMLLAGDGLFLYAFLGNAGGWSAKGVYSALALFLIPASVVSMLVALMFSTEEPVRFERLRRRWSALRGRRALLRLFFPGPGTGASLGMFLGLILVGTAVVLAYLAGHGLLMYPVQRVRLLNLAALGIATVVLTAGLGYALGAGLKRVGLSRFILFLILMGLLFGPMVSLLVRSGRARWSQPVESRLYHVDYLSAVVSAAAVANPRGWVMRSRAMPREVRTPFGTFPLMVLTVPIYLVLGVVGLLLGRRWEKRFEAGLPPLEPVVGGGTTCGPPEG